MAGFDSLKQHGFLASTLAEPVCSQPWSRCLDNGVTLNLWQTGVLRVAPAQQGSKRVLISSGIHGNETAPMELVNLIVNDIMAQKIDVNNELLFIIGNPVSANHQARFVEHNMNRLFSGAHNIKADSDELECQGSSQSNCQDYERRRTCELELFTQQFFLEGDQARYHYDCHTAIRGSHFVKFAVSPFLHQRQWSPTQLGFLEKCGIEAVLFSNQPSGTYSYFTSHHFNADSFTVELGSVKPFGQNDLNQFQQILSAFNRLIENKEVFDSSHNELITFQVIEEVFKQSDAFKLHIEDAALNFTQLPKGTLLASDQHYEYITQTEGERFVFPIQNVPNGQRALLVIKEVVL